MSLEGKIIEAAQEFKKWRCTVLLGWTMTGPNVDRVTVAQEKLFVLLDQHDEEGPYA